MWQVVFHQSFRDWFPWKSSWKYGDCIASVDTSSSKWPFYWEWDMNSSVAAIHVNWAQSHHQSFSKRSTWALFCGKFCHFCCLCLIHLLVQNLQYILNVLNIFWTHVCIQYILNVLNIFWTYCCFLFGSSTFFTWSKVRFYLLKNCHLNMYNWKCAKILSAF